MVYESAARSVDELDLIKCYPLNEIVTSVCDKYNVNHTIKEDKSISQQFNILQDSNNCTGKLYFIVFAAKLNCVLYEDIDEKKGNHESFSALSTSSSRARLVELDR